MTLKVDDVALDNPLAENVNVWLTLTSPAKVAAVNVATPDDVFALVVPPIVPVDDVTVTTVAGCDVTAFPPASTTVTAGEPATTPPDTLVLGWADTFNADAAPSVIVILLLVAVGYPDAAKVNVYEPVGPLIFRSVNVAMPLPFVVAVRVPASAGVFCRPDADGDVPSAAVTTTPAGAGLPAV